MKIVKSLKESGLLIKEICETIKNKGKEEKGGYLPMLLGILAASMCVYVRVRVYVCVCLCVYVCFCSSTLKTSSVWCWNSREEQCCVENVSFL